MQIRISAPDDHLKQTEIDEIHHDLEKIDRRLNGFREEVTAEVRVRPAERNSGHHVVVELNYGRNHLIAKADGKVATQAVREARQELLRQINDRSRRGHSSFAKGYQGGRTP